jgi:hypothetical protein
VAAIWAVPRRSTSRPVPEIDLGSFGSAIALLLGSLGWFERRHLRRLTR